jgi:hypothetical protein
MIAARSGAEFRGTARLEGRGVVACCASASLGRGLPPDDADRTVRELLDAAQHKVTEALDGRGGGHQCGGQGGDCSVQCGVTHQRLSGELQVGDVLDRPHDRSYRTARVALLLSVACHPSHGLVGHKDSVLRGPRRPTGDGQFNHRAHALAIIGMNGVDQGGDKIAGRIRWIDTEDAVHRV